MSLVMSFGRSANSNHAQGFSTMTVETFCHEADKEEDPIFDHLVATLSADDPRRVWILRRRALSLKTGHNECRLYSAFMYTDDFQDMLLGYDRFIRLLRVWFRVSTTLWGYRMAIARKRQAGPSVEYSGLHVHFTAGLQSFPIDKRLRMLVTLDKMLDGIPVTFEEYRSLNGRLEHLLDKIDEKRDAMYHHYGKIYRQGLSHGPSSVVVFEKEHVDSAAKWRQVVRTCPGRRFTVQQASLGENKPPLLLSAECLYFYYDAAKDGAKVPSLGGYAHECFFSLPLDKKYLRLPIVYIEFAAGMASGLIFGAEFPRDFRAFNMGDAEVVSNVVRGSTARAELMQFAHLKWLAIVASGKFRLPDVFDWLHLYGETNVFADAASRGELDRLHRLAAIAGLRLKRLEVPAIITSILDDLLGEYDRLVAVQAVDADITDRHPRDGCEPPTKRTTPHGRM